jgi:zinc protease
VVEWGFGGPPSVRWALLWALAVACTLATAADAEPAGTAKVGSSGDFESRSLTIPSATELRLGNGLRVVFQESHLQPQVAVLVAYEMGWRDDPVGYGELAHLVEHMTYRGSLHLGALGGLDLLERLGATAQNGMTFPDYTVYFALVPSSALANALWVESERMAFTLERFDEKSLELERNIVKNELLLRTGPDELLEYHVWREIFGGGHPYTGPAFPGKDLDAIDLSHVQWFFQQSYRPDNARLILVGDFDTRRARELVERYFGPVVNPPLRVQRRNSSTRPFSRPRTLTLESGGFRETTTVFWPASTRTPTESAAANLFVRILAGRFRGRLIDVRGLASHVDLHLTTLDFASFFKLSVEHRPDAGHAEVEREIDDVFRAARGIPWTDELPDARKEAVLEELLELESPVERGLKHLNELRTRGHPFVASRRLAELRAVGAADLEKQLHGFRATPRLVARLKRAAPNRRVPPWGRLTVE